MYINVKASINLSQKVEDAKIRARLRWLEDAENDVRVLKVRRWRERRNDREGWT
jgi:hypothetical protein